MTELELKKSRSRGSIALKILTLLGLSTVAGVVIYMKLVVPSLEVMNHKKNEDAASKTVFELSMIQKYKLKNGALQRYGTLEEMKPYLKVELIGGVKDGYQFEVVLTTEPTSDFQIFASPLKRGITGTLYFYVRKDGILKQTEKPFERDPVTKAPIYPE